MIKSFCTANVELLYNVFMLHNICYVTGFKFQITKQNFALIIFELQYMLDKLLVKINCIVESINSNN